MQKLNAVLIFTDDAGEVLWGKGQPFEARMSENADEGFVIPIPVPKMSIKSTEGHILDVHVDT